MYSTLVESLKRLYSAGRIAKDTLDVRLVDGKITQEEYDYITEATE